MSTCVVNFSDRRQWEEAKDAQGIVRLTGTAYQDGIRLSAKDLLAQLAAARHDKTALTGILSRMNGFYALVLEDEGAVIAAVDHVRSIPLFYHEGENSILVSDDAEIIRRTIQATEMGAVARSEFLLTGYVTGSETLFPALKQLKAGEFIRFDKRYGHSNIGDHYLFTHNESQDHDAEALAKGLDEAFARCISRLISYASGRQIVLPLSGGHDSRVIAIYLKKAGYDNIVAFTYGVDGNREAQRSKIVADTLGIPWHFAEYTRQKWKSVWKMRERWEYQRWASGWSSLPVVQDWLAILELRERNVFSPDCIFVPGHTGDFVSGGHIPAVAQTKQILNKADILDAIVTKHYSLTRSLRSPHLRQTLRARIENTLGTVTGDLSPAQFADTFERWEWRERQAKFICNSVRAYEYLGYDWWLPLWDKDVVSFWEKVPLTARIKRNFYVSYSNALFSSLLSKKDGIEHLPDTSDRPASKQPTALRVKILRVLRLLARLPFFLIPKGILWMVASDLHARQGRYTMRDKLYAYRMGAVHLNGASSTLFIRDGERDVQP